MLDRHMGMLSKSESWHLSLNEFHNMYYVISRYKIAQKFQKLQGYNTWEKWIQHKKNVWIYRYTFIAIVLV